MQTLSLAFAKLSVLMFYRRLFVTGAGRDWFDVISLLMLVMCTLWGAGFFLSTIFNCGRHFSDYWKPGQVHCLPYDSRPLGYSISDFLTDFTILCMPMGIVRTSLILLHLLSYSYNSTGMEPASQNSKEADRHGLVLGWSHVSKDLLNDATDYSIPTNVLPVL